MFGHILFAARWLYYQGDETLAATGFENALDTFAVIASPLFFLMVALVVLQSYYLPLRIGYYNLISEVDKETNPMRSTRHLI